MPRRPRESESFQEVSHDSRGARLFEDSLAKWPKIKESFEQQLRSDKHRPVNDTFAYLACLALALIWPDGNLHKPWLQFFPGFAWTWLGILIGLVESFVYGFFSGIIFAPIYNFYNDNN